MATINKKFYIDKLEEIDVCGHTFFSFEGGAFQLPYDVNPAAGEHTYSTCEGCKKQRQNIIDEIKRVNVFPLCCEEHKTLPSFADFNIENYKELEGSIADKIIYTAQFVINNIDNDDWFEDFQNYFEYVIESFGSFPNGYGSPYQINNFYGFLPDMIDGKRDLLSSPKISKEEINKRIDSILEHIHNAFIPAGQKRPKEDNKDFNLLLSTYSRWYKTFPFNLSYFQPLQKKYSKTIPIVNGEVRYNKYTGLSAASLHSKESLTQFLVELTKAIITNVNALKLYEKGMLNDTQKIQLELVLRNRELELTALNSGKEIDSKGYIKILKSWFTSEKKFIKEITPLLKEDESLKEKITPELSIKQIALKLVYEGAVVNRNNCGEIIKEYGHSSGEKLFQEFTYFSSSQNRKGNPTNPTPKTFQNKIELFESVIGLLSDANKQRALDELSILKINRDNLFG
ncbi:hypothetical protein [Flavobacterium capsici]|uniref:Uncharacterized protein n=1 Tax=Flavobacterium capsici TaxID=3075618 RepID=A0AA96EUF6_9FLAO|nr:MULTISPECIES: hypothetical protein [unclassified Flavobacterium]WNM18534.1 hypothetical protein RN608_10990 [Flavobacterium sp. PMR2A8]WNM22585.1 hypothetical protein RN605_04290 [Flavobacterium sp. PMTSA4]